MVRASIFTRPFSTEKKEIGIDHSFCDTEKRRKGSGFNASSVTNGPLDSPGSFGSATLPYYRIISQNPDDDHPVRIVAAHSPVSREGSP